MRRTTASLLAASLTAALSLGMAPSIASADSVLPTVLETNDTGFIPLPHDDPFYSYDGAKPLKDIAPGTVLKTRTVTLGFFGYGDTPLVAEQLLYRTQDQQRRPSVTVTTVAKLAQVGSSIMSPPTGIVSYLSFYDALGDSCSPSYTLRGGIPNDSASSQNANIEEAIVLALLAQGYAVNIPDFEGVDLHWVAGQESGWSTLDSVRAAESFLGLDAESTPVGLLGYSGGSIAGEWASELAPHYSPELNIVGTAVGGIPVHLAHNLKYVDGSESWSGVIPAVMVSLSRAFGIDTDKYASRYGKRLVNEVSDQCISSFLGNYPGLKANKLLKKRYRPFLGIPAFARVVNRLIMGSTPGHPTMPLFMGVGNGDGTGDDVMIAADVQALAYEYCQQGVPVFFSEYQGLTHTEAAGPFFPAAMAFLADRIAGLPAPDNCATIGPGNDLDPIPTRRRG